jgi:hypothetical protein
MKPRSASLDDVFQEVQFVLRADGSRLARALLLLVEGLYYSYNAAMVVILRWYGRRPSRLGAMQ